MKNIAKNEKLMLNILSLSTGCHVKAVESEKHQNGLINLAKLILQTPVCANKSIQCSISRRYENTWRLIGYGEIIETTTMEPTYTWRLISIRKILVCEYEFPVIYFLRILIFVNKFLINYKFFGFWLTHLACAKTKKRIHRKYLQGQ